MSDEEAHSPADSNASRHNRWHRVPVWNKALIGVWAVLFVLDVLQLLGTLHLPAGIQVGWWLSAANAAAAIATLVFVFRQLAAQSRR